MLGVVAHYLDANYQPQTVLLSLLRVSGKHTARNLASKLTGILLHFDLTQSFGYTITDNASENTACMNHLSEALHVDQGKRHVRCIGHIINLVAYQILFSNNMDAFEPELVISVEQLEL